MGKRLAILGAAAAMVALAVSMVVGPAGAQDDQRRTIRVVAVTTQERFVDLAPQREFSLGDKGISSANLWRHGNRVGRAGIDCTVTSTRGSGEFHCVATARFGNGQVTVQGLIRGEPETFVLPVTGGSGAYLGAEGIVHVRDVSPRRQILTFHLED
jgi:hypothetical protein